MKRKHKEVSVIVSPTSHEPQLLPTALPIPQKQNLRKKLSTGKTPLKKSSVGASTEQIDLPFDLACKSCSYKCDTISKLYVRITRLFWSIQVLEF